MYYSNAQHGENDYIVIIENSRFAAIHNDSIVCSKEATDINSAVFDGQNIYYVKKYSTRIFRTNSRFDYVCEIEGIGEAVSVIKLFGNDLNLLAYLDFYKGVRVINLNTMNHLFDSPLIEEFLDIDCSENSVFTVIGENKNWDDQEDEWVHEMLRRFTYKNGNQKIIGASYVRVFMDTFREVPIDTYASYEGNIKLPLFDYYFRGWPYYRMLTPHYAIHFCSDVYSVIVSSLKNGNVICMFRLPEGTKSYDLISFNDKTFVVTIVTHDRHLIRRYRLVCEKHDELKRINSIYNRAFTNKEWLRDNKEFIKLIELVLDDSKLVMLE